MRHVDAMIADCRGDHDAEHQRAQGIHGQVALEEALEQRRLLIGRSNAAANLAGGSEHRRASQQQQADNQYRGDHLADALEQPARIEDEKQHGGKIRQRIQPQRQGGVAGEGRHAHLERHHRSPRGGEQRADGQIHRHGKQQPGAPPQWRGEPRHAAPHARQCHHGKQRQTDRREQEAQRGTPHRCTGGHADTRRKDDVARPQEQREGHEAKAQDVGGFQMIHALNQTEKS
ncbi:hypothetical protein D3C78_1191170 [compost metagenome]